MYFQRVAIVALIAVGLSACSGDSDSSLAPVATVPTATPAPVAAIEVPASCPVTKTEPVRLESGAMRNDIAPGLNAGPVWMIAPSVVSGFDANAPLKTIWLVSGDIAGPVRISGGVAGGNAVALFAYNVPFPEPPANATQAQADAYNDASRALLIDVRGPDLVIDSPHGMRDDQRGYIFYSASGCWTFTIETNVGRYEIVRYIHAGT
ncbi:MAG: hypothetical protein GEU75_06335 [Dehalococcoidia bacterium]|nr:hypothetical protein [Dehalococcoidia bacterium]